MSRRGPVRIDLEDTAHGPAPGPQDAAPVPDPVAPVGSGPAGRGTAMQVAATLTARRRWGAVTRLFWGALVALVGFVVSLAAWDFVTRLLVAQPILGWIATGLIALILVALAIIALREAAAFARLGRIDSLHREAAAARAAGDLAAGRAVAARLERLYAGRADLRLGREAVMKRQGDIFDVETLFTVLEDGLMAPLDAAAMREVEAAARQVATVTALVPLALADVVTALTANLRMIRRIAEIYGGRSSTLGAWRLTRAVMTHLVATGAVAVGDDLIGSVAGGSVLSRVSRRFGEGVVNGALTARVGVAAMEVCRPLPFTASRRPSVTRLVRRALTGLFGGSAGTKE